MFRLLMGALVASGLAFAAANAPVRAQAAPAAEAELKEWFYAEGTSVFGPVGITELRQLAMATIKAETQVFVLRNGWRPAKDHPELADLFPQAAAPAPVAQGVPAPPPPPPPGPSKADLNAQMLSYLQGTWTSEGPTQIGGMPYKLEILANYGANNVLTGTMTTYELSGALLLALPMEGTYQVQAIDEQTMSVSATYRFLTAAGSTGNDSSTVTVRIVDANTLQGLKTGSLIKRVR